MTKELSVYTMNTLNMGRAVDTSRAEQIKILGDVLLNQNADVFVLPEIPEGFLSSYGVNQFPEKVGNGVEKLVSGSVGVVADVVTGTPVVIADTVNNISGGWLGFFSSPVSFVSGAVSAIGKAAGALVGQVAGGATELVAGGLTMVVKPVVQTGLSVFSGGAPNVVGEEQNLKELVGYLNANTTGAAYNYVTNGTTATITKLTMLEVKANGAGGSSFVLDLDKSGGVSKGDIHVDSIHLPAENYAAWLPRGLEQHGFEGQIGEPNTDLQAIHALNIASGRTEKINHVIAAHDKDYADLPHLVTGDFNEPSHLDWTEQTKDLYEHNGVVYAWDTTAKLEASGYTDTFRELYPDVVKNPGFTWSSPVDGGSFKGSPIDDRDRIDFTFYKSGKDADIKPIAINLVGNEGFFVANKLVEKGGSQDDIILSEGIPVWPTDHKGLHVTIEVVSSPDVAVADIPLVGINASTVEVV